MNQSPGFEGTGHEEKIYKLKTALYGIKQAPRVRDKNIASFSSWISPRVEQNILCESYL